VRRVELEVLRYNPETDREPHFQRYSVECQEEWVVLDALNHVKETLDPTLSYRWSCHMAVCGSCGMTAAADSLQAVYPVHQLPAVDTPPVRNAG